MVDVTHDQAVGILKSTQDRVVLRIEKNAIAHAMPPSYEEVRIRAGTINR